MIETDRRYFFHGKSFGHLIRIRFVTDEEVASGLMIRIGYEECNPCVRWDLRAAMGAMRAVLSAEGADAWSEADRYNTAVHLEGLYDAVDKYGLPPPCRARRGDVIMEGNIG